MTNEIRDYRILTESQKEDLLDEAIQLIKYFLDRVEDGSIRSKTTYRKYKDFMDKCLIEFDTDAL